MQDGAFGVATTLIVIGFWVFLAGCGGSAPVMVETMKPEDPGPLVYSDYEAFDASKYADDPVAADVDFVHDVPEALLQNRADAGVEQTVSGYRVQVMATLDPAEAEAAQEELKIWWDTIAGALPQESVLGANMEVYRLFRQPYYRIRLGDLTRRADAQELLNLVSNRFVGAFIVPDQVTVRK